MILLNNIQSILSNKDEIFSFVKSEKYNIYSFTETHVTSDITEGELYIDGYYFLKCDSLSRFTGGIIMYIKDNFPVEVICNQNINNELWYMGIKYKDVRNRMINFICLYRSPSSSIAEFLKHINILINMLNCKEEIVIIAGDFNINITESTFYANKLLSVMREYGFQQYVREHTRITSNSQTTIDLVFSNNINTSVKVKRTPKLSDHDLLEITPAIEMRKKPQHFLINDDYRVEVRNFKTFNKDRFQGFLVTSPWTTMPQHVNIIAEELYVNIRSILDLMAPTKKVMSRNTMKGKWYDEEIIYQTKKRDFCYKRALVKRDAESWEEYKKEKRISTKLIKDKKTNYFSKLIDANKSNSKRMWKILKEAIDGENGSKEVNYMKFGNEIITNPEEIATRYNEFIVNSISSLVVSKPLTNILKLGYKRKFRFQPITYRDIMNEVKKMKNKSSSDFLNGKLVGYGGEYIIHKIRDIFNMSINTGVFPECWKNSYVTPIRKISRAENPTEFRPINTLPYIEKIFERIIKNQLMDYLKKHDILIENQSAYREKHSCETALQLIISRWKLWLDDKNKVIIAAFLDLSRAFETINVDILLWKLNSIGICDIELRWFESYLTGRTQITKVKGQQSAEMPIRHGVPQGSVLGPLLFVLYMNDIVDAVKKNKNVCLNLFADDTLVAVEDADACSAAQRLNIVLSDLGTWMKTNNLVLNVKKCNILVLGRKKSVSKVPDIILDKEKLSIVQSVKYLGVYIDSELNFKTHIEKLIQKFAQRVNYFSRVAKSLNLKCRVDIYKSIVAPYFQYCPTILIYANNTDLNRIQVIQNRAMRIILKCNGYTPIRLMLECLGFLTVRQYYMYQTLYFIFKINNNFLPMYLKHQLVVVHEIHEYQTRNCQDFYIGRTNKGSTKKSLFFDGLKAFNDLPQELKSIRNKHCFKAELKQHVQVNY